MPETCSRPLSAATVDDLAAGVDAEIRALEDRQHEVLTGLRDAVADLVSHAQLAVAEVGWQTGNSQPDAISTAGRICGAYRGDSPWLPCALEPHEGDGHEDEHGDAWQAVGVCARSKADDRG